MSDEPVTHCKTCKTSWAYCDIFADGQCATCLAKEVERLQAVESARLASSAGDADEIERLWDFVRSQPCNCWGDFWPTEGIPCERCKLLAARAAGGGDGEIG